MLDKKPTPLAQRSRGWQALGRLGAGLCLAAMIVLSSLAQEKPPPPPPMDDLPREALSQDDVEVLTRGPVHEGFAEPLANDPEAGLIVPRKPPEDIAEVAPDFKPEGDDVVWIPGYWAWDDDRDNFLWVSGIWRKLPPGLRWIPGYWVDADADGDWQWVSGLWVPDHLLGRYLARCRGTAARGDGADRGRWWNAGRRGPARRSRSLWHLP